MLNTKRFSMSAQNSQAVSIWQQTKTCLPYLNGLSPQHRAVRFHSKINSPSANGLNSPNHNHTEQVNELITVWAYVECESIGTWIQTHRLWPAGNKLILLPPSHHKHHLVYEPTTPVKENPLKTSVLTESRRKYEQVVKKWLPMFARQLKMTRKSPVVSFQIAGITTAFTCRSTATIYQIRDTSAALFSRSGFYFLPLPTTGNVFPLRSTKLAPISCRHSLDTST